MKRSILSILRPRVTVMAIARSLRFPIPPVLITYREGSKVKRVAIPQNY